MSFALDVVFKQDDFVLVCLFSVFKLHLDETEAPAAVGGSIPHDDGVCDGAEVFKIFNKIRF